MTVAQLLAEMSNDEYMRWYVYYGRKNQRQEMSTWRQRIRSMKR